MALLLIGCKTTKRVESFSDSETLSLKSGTKTELYQIRRNKDLAEVITEEITVTPVTIKDGEGKETLSEEKKITRTIERYLSEEETEDVKKDEETEQEDYEDKSGSEFNRETEGQEVVKDITKGFTEGILKHLFGDFFKKVSAIVLLILFVVVLFFIRKKKSNS